MGRASLEARAIRGEEVGGAGPGRPPPRHVDRPDPVFRRHLDRDLPVAVRASGVWIEDAAGRRYLDGTSGAFVVNQGYGVQAIEAAVTAQMAKIVFAHSELFANEAQARFATALVALAPEGFGRVWMSTSGAAANEAAVKLARHYHLIRGEPERSLVIARDNAYHGSSLGALALTGHRPRRELYEPLLVRHPHIPPPTCRRCPLGLAQPSCATACADELERAIERAGRGRVAAFIVEPVAGGPLGALVSPPGYLQRIRSICDRHGVLMIADEVTTALGRTGRDFGVQHWGVTPDLITLAKGLANGVLPIGAVMVHDRIYDEFASRAVSFRHGETFTGHPLIAAAGAATLANYVEGQMLERVVRAATWLDRRLATLARHALVGDVRGIGLLRGIELVRDRATMEPFDRGLKMAERVAAACRDSGVLVIPGSGAADGVRGDTITLAPPFVISEEETGILVKALGNALDTVAGGLAIA